MVDPDVTSRANPDVAEIWHWTVGNIKGNDISTGDVLCEYVGSLPAQGSGLHRYIFLLFKQQHGRIQFNEPHVYGNSANGRYNFSTRNFISKYHLGKPIEGNFYQAEYDDSWAQIVADLNFEF